MECNKEEAVRAKELAERNLLKNEFSTALRMAQKSQRLFPELENITQLLAVCEVHSAAEKRIGSEQDWYGILQIQKSADEISIMKQYRKLALLLHPDKNKLAGSEAAFKLIGEARRILGDKAKRSLYDMKLRSLETKAQLQKPPPPPPPTYQRNQKTSSVKSGATSNKSGNASTSHFSGSNGVPREDEGTFWTICPTCYVKYEYYRSYLGRALRCQACKKPFKAFEVIEGTGAAPASSVRGPTAAKKDTSSGVSSTSERGTGNPWHPSSKERYEESVFKTKNSADNGGSTQTEERVHRKANEGTRKNGGGKNLPKAGATKVEDTSDSGPSNLERGRKECQVNSGKTFKKVNGNANLENEGDTVQSGSGPNLSHPTRRSTRQKRQASYSEDTDHGGNDHLVTPKKSRSSCAGEGESSMQNNVDSSVTAGDKNDKKSVDPNKSLVSDAQQLTCPDSEFNDFEKDKKQGFAVNQVWAIYDKTDGMPRYYARVRKVFSSGFKLKITWFEADPDEKYKDEVDWCNENLPISCGRYEMGGSEDAEDYHMFSHQMSCTKGDKRGTYVICPRKGETWALFKNWDLKWVSNPEKHLDSLEYEFVEVLSDFVEERGATVASLVKIRGFLSLFQLNEASPFQVPRSELYRFSHRVPSFRMSGKERIGVPEGSFELDPAALPLDLVSRSVGIPMKRNLETEPSLVRRSPRGKEPSLPQANSDSAATEVPSRKANEAQKQKMDRSTSTAHGELNTPTKRQKIGPNHVNLPVRKSPRVSSAK